MELLRKILTKIESERLKRDCQSQEIINKKRVKKRVKEMLRKKWIESKDEE